MKLTFLGSGSAFTVGDQNYQSNMLLETGSKKRLLIDCGSDARHALHDLGFTHQDIHDVYISHLHADHIGGLEWLAFSSKYESSNNKPGLHLSDQLVDDLWNRALSAGLNPYKNSTIQLSDYFNVIPISNETFQWEGTTFHLFPTLHVTCGNWKMPSYGLWFKTHQKTILITTDTQLTDKMIEFYTQCDLIFHDCETGAHKTRIHTHYNELKFLSPLIKSKMWLYHYQPGPLPPAKEDGFKGFVKKGQYFDFNDAKIYK